MLTDEKIKEVFDENGGIVRTGTLLENGITARNLRQLQEDGTIECIKHGVYQYIDEDAFSEIPILVSLFPDAVLCMESALQYYGYTERTPSAWHLAVDNNTARSRFRISWPKVQPHFVASSKFPIGITTAEIEGTEIKVYDRERTICDCLLHRNKLDAEVFNQAVKGYLQDENRQVAVLAEYAGKLRVSGKVREVLSVWL